MELEVQLSERNVTIELTDEARVWLGKKGYDRNFGARPLSRVIQEHIKRPLSEELLFGALTNGGIARVKVEDGKICFDYLEPAPKARPKKRKSPPKGSGPKGDGPKDPTGDEKGGLPVKAGRSPVPAVVK